MRFSVVYTDRSDNSFNIHQPPYIDRLKPLPSDANFVLLLQYRAQLSWLIHSRSDVYVVTSKLAHVTEKSSTYSMCSNTILQYVTCRTSSICLFVHAILIPRVYTYGPILMHHSIPTLTTCHSSATSCCWQTSTIMPLFCTTPATIVAESRDPY